MATVRLTLLLLLLLYCAGKGEAAPEGRGKASSPRADAKDAAQPGPKRLCRWPSPGVPLARPRCGARK